MTAPKVAVVIIHWNKRSLLETFLPSVCKSTWPNLEIWLADNASEDDSVAWVKTNFPQVKCLVLDGNYGYAGGYNRALQKIEADYYVLLNNDVEVPAGWIEPVIELMQKNEQAAAAQPKILQYANKDYFEYAGAAGGFMDAYGYAFCRGRLFECLEKDEGQYNDSREIFWASGACLFIRAKAFHEAGGLDEDFFAHMEEIDLCWRLQLLGHTVWYCGNSAVYHLGGSTLQQGHPKKTYLNFRNNLQMLLKNDDTLRLLWLIPVRSTLDLLSSIFFLMNARTEHSAAVHKAHAHFFFKFGKWLKARKQVQHKKVHAALHGLYPGSVVFEHFARRVQSFSKLKSIGKISG